MTKTWKEWVCVLARECMEHLNQAHGADYMTEKGKKLEMYASIRAEHAAEAARMICEDNWK